MEHLPSILSALILAGVLWLYKTANDTARDVVAIRATLQNVTVEVEKLRDRLHDLRSYLQEIETRVSILEERRATRRDRS